MADVHYISRPALVHALKGREGKTYTAKCGWVTEDNKTVTGWHDQVTCDDCSPTRRTTP